LTLVLIPEYVTKAAAAASVAAHHSNNSFYNVTTPHNNHQFTAIKPALASISSKKLEDFVGAKFYCPHALDCIQIMEKTLEFSSTVLSTLFPYRSYNATNRNKTKTMATNILK